MFSNPVPFLEEGERTGVKMQVGSGPALDLLSLLCSSKAQQVFTPHLRGVWRRPTPSAMACLCNAFFSLTPHCCLLGTYLCAGEDSAPLLPGASAEGSGLASHTKPVSYTHLTLPTTGIRCRSRWSPYH